ncbi:MAG TPA: LA2681 family HEPN domain-containing protein [Chitinophagales bacterium]|nr:LA2681 family HEPN domain-containing protein [Chitinophagales bacterium]
MQNALKLKEKINILLDHNKYDEAMKELSIQTKISIEKENPNLFLFAEIAGSYISLGDESNNILAVNKGIAIFQENREILKSVISEDSLDYCLGNGFQAIYKIKTQNIDNYFVKPENIRDELFDAKQSYLKVFKKINLDYLDDFAIKILTNLGNNLNHSGRIVEALQLFDIVLNHKPKFPEAVVSKADGLRYMIQSTDCPKTLWLYSEIYKLYSIASENKIVIEEINKNVEWGKKEFGQLLIDNDINLDTLENEFELNEIEFKNHPEDIKFYLENFMNLSEHSLYCKCNGAKTDDLTIGYPGYKTNDKRIIQLELLNNRIKSEFSLAKNLYFDFTKQTQKDNVHYENVLNGIVNGIKYEKLRTSFRLCFGILDKIAEGICYLLELEIKEGEKIYFESFWKTSKNAQRWIKINSFQNIHLTALYSIASDLNKKNGEFGFYKQWRNKLEHGLFSLTNKNYINDDVNENQFSIKTSSDDFENKTKHLLQLTRASIFSFVFCVRHELITKNNSPA